MPDGSLNSIYNFLQISDSIATSGQPTEAQFSTIKTAGYTVVVNLALPDSTNAIPHERETIEAQGMEYVHIPVIWENPTLGDVDRFFQVMEENRDQKVFVHCAANMRVSAFMYLYRRVHQHINDADATSDLHKIWVPNSVWQRFIQQVIQRGPS